MHCGPRGCSTPETCRRKGCQGSSAYGSTKPNMDSGKYVPIVSKSTKSKSAVKKLNTWRCEYAPPVNVNYH